MALKTCGTPGITYLHSKNSLVKILYNYVFRCSEQVAIFAKIYKKRNKIIETLQGLYMSSLFYLILNIKTPMVFLKEYPLITIYSNRMLKKITIFQLRQLFK